MFVTVPAGSTGTAGVTRIDHDHAHACQSRLVLYKLTQLRERPRTMPPSLLNAQPLLGTLADMHQILQRECLAFTGGFLYEALTDTVIYVFLKASLPAAIPFQATFGVFRANGLQAITAALVAFTHPINLFSAECVTIAGGTQIDNSKITADHAQRFVGLRHLLRLRDAQIPRIALADQFCATDRPTQIVQVVALEVTKLKLGHNPTMQRIQRHLIALHQAVGARIVTDRAIKTEGWTCRVCVLAAGAYRFGGFIPCTARQLRPKTKLGASCTIDDVMQGVLVRNSLFPRDGRAIAGSRVEGRLRFAQCRINCAINTQFTADRSCGEGITHNVVVAHSYLRCKRMFEGGLGADFSMTTLVFDLPAAPYASFESVAADVLRTEPERTLLCPDAAVLLLTALAHYHAGSYRHSLRVAHLAGELAAVLGYRRHDVHRVWLAGLLHDVGLINLPRSLLNKADHLTAHEQAIWQHHPIGGAHLLVPDGAFIPLVPIVATHHERPDGLGYPQRLTLPHIPHAALILAVADAAERFTSRLAQTHPVDLAELRRWLLCGAGTAWDTGVVSALAALLPHEDPPPTGGELLLGRTTTSTMATHTTPPCDVYRGRAGNE